MQDICLHISEFEDIIYIKNTSMQNISLQNTDKQNNKHKIMIFKCTHIKIKA